MAKTYLGQTAAKILSTAKVCQMGAGTFEIVVKSRDNENLRAYLGERRDGWGGTVRDVLVLDGVGRSVRLEMSARSLARLEQLEAEAESRYPVEQLPIE